MPFEPPGRRAREHVEQQLREAILDRCSADEPVLGAPERSGAPMH